QDPATAGWLDEKRLFQNYKQLQFFDTLALYFNRVHPGERGDATFEHVPMSAAEDATITVRPRAAGGYALSPWPFAASEAEFPFAGRRIESGLDAKHGGWAKALAAAPTVWERFRLVAA